MKNEFLNLTEENLPPLRHASLAEKNVSYRESGEGDPLVFMHGANGDSRSWIAQFAAFSPSYRVIAWDTPGFGSSDLCAPSVDAYAETAAMFLEKIAAGQSITLVGHSMGGIIAARLASAKDSPVAKLILSCSHLGRGSPSDAPLSKNYLARLDDLQTMDANAYGLKRAKAMLPNNVPEKIMRYLAMLAADASLAGQKNSLRMMQETNNAACAKKITAPSLIITGGLDRVATKRKTDALRQQMPSAQYVNIPAVGHAPYLEDAQSFNELMKRFLSDSRLELSAGI